MTDDDVAARFATLAERVNGNAALVHRGRYLSTKFLTGTPALPVHVTVHRGAIERVETGPAPMRSWAFALRAGPEDWRRFWQPMPEPGWHDLLAMARFGRLTIEGELQPLMANLRYIKEVLETPRTRTREAAA
jgi:hypothetical protein